MIFCSAFEMCAILNPYYFYLCYYFLILLFSTSISHQIFDIFGGEFDFLESKAMLSDS